MLLTVWQVEKVEGTVITVGQCAALEAVATVFRACTDHHPVVTATYLGTEVLLYYSQA